MRQTKFLFLLTLTAALYAQQPKVGRQRSPVLCDHAAPPRGMHWRCDDPDNSCNCRLESDTPGGPGLVDDDGSLKNPSLAGGAIHAEDFYTMMNSLASDWTSGANASIAAIFTQTAAYTNASRNQTYKGKSALSRIFGSANHETRTGRVEWHHLLFNERDQIGAGEFTVEGVHRRHGMAIVKMEAGKISNWREYDTPSTLSWQEFSDENPF